MRATEELDVPLALGPVDGGDLRQRVAEALRGAIRCGTFGTGQRLPASRVLAGHLGVSRSTVTSALAELEGEGWVEARHGSGTYVAATLTGMLAPTAPQTVGAAASGPRPGRSHRPIDLLPGRPDTTGLADEAWRRAWREAVAGPIGSDYPPPAGLPTLRAAVADHVRRARGVACDPGQVVVTAGTSDAVRLLADAVGVAGRTAVVEDPGYPTVRSILRRAGARALATVPVDDHGLVPAALARVPDDARLLHITPSHQYPMGGLLPVDRRVAVLRWAAERSVLVLEDDFDGEFRFGTSPVPALASLDTAGCVAYVGTFSKSLAPALRLGFAVVPPALVDEVVAVRVETGAPVSALVQDAVARLLTGGGVRRHIARQRRVYAERRTRLVRRLGALPGVVGVRGLDAGLHAVVALAADRDPAAAVRRAAAGGILVADLDDYRTRPDPAAPGIVIGYAHPTAAELDRALDVLSAALA